MGIVDPVMFVMVATVHQLVSNKTNSVYSILIYIQQDATLHSLFYFETALHVLGGTITHLQERKQLCLLHLLGNDSM
jgi:hypothetical protein